jgi:hypothetical protein
MDGVGQIASTAAQTTALLSQLAAIPTYGGALRRPKKISGVSPAKYCFFEISSPVLIPANS